MSAKNTVSTLGTLHDLFLVNPLYGLKEFCSALYQFQPDFILSEVLKENPNAGDAAIDGGIEQSIVFAYAEEQGIPVLPTDWFDGEFIRQMEVENSKATPELIAKLESMSDFRSGFQSASLLELHSEAVQDNLRQIYKVFEEYGLMSSRLRNDRIVENIKVELSKLSGKKVLIVYGMDHKFFIDDSLANMSSVEAIPVRAWFKPQTADQFKISTGFKRSIIKNLQSSQVLLAERLRTQIIAEELRNKLQAKLPRFTNWISSISEL